MIPKYLNDSKYSVASSTQKHSLRAIRKNDYRSFEIPKNFS